MWLEELGLQTKRVIRGMLVRRDEPDLMRKQVQLDLYEVLDQLKGLG